MNWFKTIVGGVAGAGLAAGVVTHFGIGDSAQVLTTLGMVFLGMSAGIE